MGKSATYLPNIQQNHRPRPFNRLRALPHLLNPHTKLTTIPLDDPAPTKKPHNPRTRAKATKHDRHAPILVHMGDGFGAGAGSVDVRTGVRGEDGECGGRQALGGQVDVGAGERGGGSVKEGLGESPFF